MFYVLMPAFNAESVIRQAIDSVVGQTVDDWRLVIVNDGSTDGTARVVQGVDDSRITLLNVGRNVGVAAALNVGLSWIRSHCGGDLSDVFVARLDADDVMVPHRLEVQRDFLVQHPDVHVCHSGMRIMDSGRVVVPPVSHGALWAYLFFGNAVSHPTVMFRGSVVPWVWYRPQLDGAEDYALWVELISRGVRFGAVKDALVEYRPGGVSSRASSDERDRLRRGVLRLLFAYCGIDAPSDKWAMYVALRVNNTESRRVLQDILRGYERNGYDPVVVQGLFNTVMEVSGE